MSRARKGWIIFWALVSISCLANGQPIASAVLCWIFIIVIIQRAKRDNKENSKSGKIKE